jgi:protein-S-isoprenylcysteine O-methyltransferase Ste14
MALIEEMDRQGNTLFRWRSFIPLALYAMAFGVIWADADHRDLRNDSLFVGLCIGLSMLGQIIRALAIGYVPRGTSGRNTKEGQVAESLNSKGIYSTVRHPLYLGNFFMWMGLVYVANWWFVVVCVLLFWLYYERIMFAEEHFLRKKFGQIYLDWAAKTPAFVPRPGQWTAPGIFFSMRNVLKREYNGFFAVFLSFTLLNVMKNYKEFASLDLEFLVDGIWKVLFPAALVLWVVLRTLKKRTKMLDVEGREYVG